MIFNFNYDFDLLPHLNLKIFRVEVEETTINGSFNMIFLGHSISFAYRDHINIVAR